MKNLVLVILCAADEISENFFVTHDNENTNVTWFFWRKFPSYLTLPDMNWVVLRTMFIR